MRAKGGQGCGSLWTGRGRAARSEKRRTEKQPLARKHCCSRLRLCASAAQHGMNENAAAASALGRRFLEAKPFQISMCEPEKAVENEFDVIGAITLSHWERLSKGQLTYSLRWTADTGDVATASPVDFAILRYHCDASLSFPDKTSCGK